MGLEDWAFAATIGQFVLVAVSLFIIWFQLRYASKLARAANAQALAEQAGSFNALLIQDSEVARIWYSHGVDLDTDEFQAIAARERYSELLVQWLIIHENVYYQKRKKLLDPEVYETWRRDLERTVKQHSLRELGCELTEIFTGEFGQHLLKLQADNRTDRQDGDG